MLRLVFALVFFACLPAAAQPALERVVIVERHGVRVPNLTPALEAGRTWPIWPVPAGDLTPHGSAGMTLMGTYLRADLARQIFWPATGCPAPDTAAIWADGRTKRTIASGDALLAGLFPGCNLTAQHASLKKPDPIFDGIETGACKPDPAAVLANVANALIQETASVRYATALAALAKLLPPVPGPNTVAIAKSGAIIDGPLATGAIQAEALSMEYAQGMDGPAFGWGDATPQTLAAILPLRVLYATLTRRNPINANANAARLATAILAALHAQPGLPFAPQVTPRFTGIIGHDTTLSNLAGLLGTDWTLPGQPDPTPPGAAILFRLYADQSLKISLLYQTANQLHDLTKLDATTPPGQVDLHPAQCPATGCTLAAVTEILTNAIPAQCR